MNRLKRSLTGSGSSRRSKKQPEPSKPPRMVPLIPGNFKSNYDRLAKLKFKSPKYLWIEDLSELGIDEDLHSIIVKCGWEHLMAIREPSYREITLEFFSSFAFKGGNARDSVKLRLMNTKYVMLGIGFQLLVSIACFK